MSLYNLIRFAILGRSSSEGERDGMNSRPVPSGQRSGQDQATRFFPWGFDSRVPAGARAVTVAPGGGTQQCVVGARHDKYPPDYDDAEWTTILHNEVTGTWVKLRKDGGAEIEAKGASVVLTKDGEININAASNKYIRLNVAGSGQKVIRQGDPVIMTAAFEIWLLGLASAAMYPIPIPSTFGVADGGAENVRA